MAAAAERIEVQVTPSPEKSHQFYRHAAQGFQQKTDDTVIKMNERVGMLPGTVKEQQQK